MRSILPLPSTPILGTCLVLLLSLACQLQPVEVPPSAYSQESIYKALTEDVLHHWFPAVIDSLEGGYLTNFEFDWKVSGRQEKMIVTQGRHLWTSSKAAEMFPDDPRYRKSAEHGAPWLIHQMWDSTYGGFFQYVTREGEPIADESGHIPKRAYGNAFGIYGLAAYYHLTQDEEALEAAKRAFNWLEAHSHDPQYGGYFEALSREGEVLMPAEGESHSQSHIGLKDYNSSIHLLEAFAELYAVWPDSLLKERLKEMLILVRDTFTTDKGYLELYFEPDWTVLSYQDSTPEVREQNFQTDHITPGHDIETAFLIWEAAEVLGEEQEETLEVAKKMVDHSLSAGFDKQKGGFYERCYYVPEKEGITVLDDRKNWWAQAEGFHSLVLFGKLFPEESYYPEAAALQWKYIQEHIMDPTHGGWYSYGIDKDPTQATKRKGHAWKSAYHNGRALMSSLRLLGEAEINH